MNLRLVAAAVTSVVILGLAGCSPDVTPEESKVVSAPPTGGTAGDATPAPSADQNAAVAQRSAGDAPPQAGEDAAPVDDAAKGQDDKKTD